MKLFALLKVFLLFLSTSFGLKGLDDYIGEFDIKVDLWENCAKYNKEYIEADYKLLLDKKEYSILANVTIKKAIQTVRFSAAIFIKTKGFFKRISTIENFTFCDEKAGILIFKNLGINVTKRCSIQKGNYSGKINFKETGRALTGDRTFYGTYKLNIKAFNEKTDIFCFKIVEDILKRV